MPLARALAALRDLGLNLVGFLLTVGAAGALGAGVRARVDRLLARGHLWGALAFIVVVAGVWAAVFGLIRREHLMNPEGKVLPLSLAGFLLGAAAAWVYIFAGLSYTLMRLGVVQYAAASPDDLLFQLTDAYAWHFLDLLPGVGITGALGWECPVDLQGGRRGALLVLFRVAVLYQIFTKGRRILKEEPGGTEPAQ